MKIIGKSIIDLVLMPIDHLLVFFQKIKLGAKDKQLADRILDACETGIVEKTVEWTQLV